MYIGKEMKKMMETEMKARGFNSVMDIISDTDFSIEEKFWDIVEVVQDMQKELIELNDFVISNNK